MAKYIYFFGGGKAEGHAGLKETLGGKGANLAEMSRIGLPVPPGFTLSTDVCDYYYKHGKKHPPALKREVDKNLARLERVRRQRFGDTKNPLLVSVRSGAAISMPGMMETILNLGLNDAAVEGLAKKTGNRRLALDAYRRLIQMYGSTAMGVERENFEKELDRIKETRTRPRLGRAAGEKILDTEVSAGELEELLVELKRVYKEHTGEDFPQDAKKQLWGAIGAVVGSWMIEKAVTYRRVEGISGLKGTAVNVQTMVFGNTGENSGTGVAFTRDPSSGENLFYGDLLINAQGEDVVAGIRTPLHLKELAKLMPPIYKQLVRVRDKLERHYRDMQDLEFTIEDGELFMLQTRVGKRTPYAAFRMAVEMAKGGLITKEEAIGRIKPKDVESLFYPVIDSKVDRATLEAARITTGIDAVPGAATGEVTFSAEEAESRAAEGAGVLLVRKETSPEDVGGMAVAQGILTATGGKTSHAAVVARGWGKCCIVGAGALEIDYDARELRVGDVVVRAGEKLTLNGSNGDIYRGEMPLVRPEPPKEYTTLMSWCDKVRRLKVRANADTPRDARAAREFGAQGIGLTRTEHMFFTDFEVPEDSEKRQLAIQEMIVADSAEARRAALGKLLPFQRRDFIGIFEAMRGLPVTIRLLDPPLHEFAPKAREEVERLSRATGVAAGRIEARSAQLHESNPMLGHRGCRLSITYPEILEMQVTAIIEAAANCAKRKIKVLPEIMIPLVMHARELELLAARTREVANAVLAREKVKVPYMVGTMIELPRAALTADEVAHFAEFFSFGTNDLTQTTLGISRDDYGSFIGDYVDEKKAGVFEDDPFQSLDRSGVGQLVRMGTERGRAGRAAFARAKRLPKAKGYLKVGICGEHGGEEKSVLFCHEVGMDYVSCSPFRVPIARLAAAKAVILEKGAKKAARKSKKKARPKRKAKPKKKTKAKTKKRGRRR